MNYKGEIFLNLDDSILKKLNEIADQISYQLTTPSKYLVLSEHGKFGKKEFNRYWKEISINNPNGNKYSKHEYKGIYAFGQFENNKLNILYIGISQTIRRRFFKHTKEKTREGATWAYNILKHQNEHGLSKSDLIKLIPNIQSSLIKNCRFTFVKEDDNMIMHLAEVYCANRLKAFWNSFETH